MSDKSPLSAGDSTEYIDALLAFLGDRDPLDAFAATPDALRTAAKAVPEALLRTPEAPGKWSVIHVVQHLVVTEVLADADQLDHRLGYHVVPSHRSATFRSTKYWPTGVLILSISTARFPTMRGCR